MKAFRVVAYLLILSGISWIVDFFVEMVVFRRFNFNVGFIGIFIGLGLLRFERRWLTAAKWYTGIGLIGLPAIAMIMASATSIPFTFFGFTVGHLGVDTGLLLLVVCFGYLWWQLKVLNGPEIRKRFAG